MSFTFCANSSSSLGPAGVAGGGGTVTVTRAEADSFPPGPFAYRVYVVESDGATCSDPLGCWGPSVWVVIPSASMLISFAFAVSHVRVVDWPFSIASGLTVSEAVGAAGGGGGGAVEVTFALWHALSITAALSVRISVTRTVRFFIILSSTVWLCETLDLPAGWYPCGKTPADEHSL
jgi:hypothetical protein